MANPNPNPATRFQPGNRRGGRRRTEPLTSELRRLLKQRPDATAGSNAALIAEALITQARAGDVLAARLVFDYVEGKPLQRVQLDVRQEAERLAAIHGVDAQQLFATAEAIANGRG